MISGVALGDALEPLGLEIGLEVGLEAGLKAGLEVGLEPLLPRPLLLAIGVILWGGL